MFRSFSRDGTPVLRGDLHAHAYGALICVAHFPTGHSSQNKAWNIHPATPIPWFVCVALACILLSCNSAGAGTVPLSVVKQQPEAAKRGLVVLRSDKPLGDQQIDWITSTAQRAYEFDLKQLGWDAADPAFNKPFNVVVISRAMLSDKGWKLGGGTFSGEIFAINGRSLEDQQPYYIGVIAHELTHLLVNRRFRQMNLHELGWYPLMGEAIAIENGMRFRVLNEPDLYPDHRLPASKALEQMTADAVRQNFADAARQRAHHDSDMGLLFIEFLKNLKDAKLSPEESQMRLGRILTRMSQNGTHFGAAFQSEFGITLDSAQNQFIQHMHRTEGDPASRFAGTILMPRADYHRAR